MFSCFCANKKKNSFERKSLEETFNSNDNHRMNKQHDINPIQNKNALKTQQEKASPRVPPAQLSRFNKQMKQKAQKENYKKEDNSKDKKNNQVLLQGKDKQKKLLSNCQSQQQQQKSSLQSQQQQKDSQTVPYNSKKSVSEISTPKGRSHINIKNYKKQKSKNHSQQKSKKCFSKTNNQDVLSKYLSNEMVILNFHTSPYDQQQSLFNKKVGIDTKGQLSIDYSKYSEQDKQIGSSEILELDQEIQSKLNQLQKMPFQQAQVRLRHHTDQFQSIKINDKQKLNALHKSQKTAHSRFSNKNNKKNKDKKIKQKQFQHIDDIMDDLESADEDTQTKLQQKIKQLFFKQCQGSKNLSQFSSISYTERNKQPSSQQKKSLSEYIKNAIQTQIQLIQQEPYYFRSISQIPHIKLQNLWNYKKESNQTQQQNHENQMLDETLQEAENSFHCNSINEEFSRALITKCDIKLVEKIFQKMTYQQKNSKDGKGYCPVHLLLLMTIRDQKLFEFAKKVMHHPDVNLNQIKGPTGWSPLQQVISYKHVRLTPNVFVACHKKKLALIRQSIKKSTELLSKLPEFQLQLDIKVDSFIPLLSSLTPNDTISIIKIKNKLLINYTLVGYEYLSCKRRDMGFLLDGDKGTIYAINRSKQIYCDLLEELDKEQIQMLVVQSLQMETKKIQPLIKNLDIKQVRSIFDNQITQKINGYQAKKYSFQANYTSLTEKRMPSKLIKPEQLSQLQKAKSSSSSYHLQQLNHLENWQSYLAYEPQINIKPKNKNKKIQLQMWLSQKQQFNFNFLNLIQIFQIFSLCNPLAKIISQFLSLHLSQISTFKDKFPVKIDIPINFSLYFNLEFKGLEYQILKKDNLDIQSNLKKISRKEFQNIKESKQKRYFAFNVFT